MARLRRRASQSSARNTTLEVEALGKTKTEARLFLNEGQALELDDVIDRLQHFGNDHETSDLEISKVGDFWCLTHTGTSLGELVANVYFAQRDGSIVVLSIVRDGTEPKASILEAKLANRLQHYVRRKG